MCHVPVVRGPESLSFLLDARGIVGYKLLIGRGMDVGVWISRLEFDDLPCWPEFFNVHKGDDSCLAVGGLGSQLYVYGNLKEGTRHHGNGLKGAEAFQDRKSVV